MASGRSLPPPAGEQHAYTFRPWKQSDIFDVTRMVTGHPIRFVDVFVEPTPEATSAGFTISQVEVFGTELLP